MWILLVALAGGLAAWAAGQKYAKDIKPAQPLTTPLTPGRVYLLIVKNMRPGAPVNIIQAWGAVLMGFNEPAAQMVDGALGPGNLTYEFHFNWIGTKKGAFTWDSAYALDDVGSAYIG